MTNLEKYNNAFIVAFDVDINELKDLKYGFSSNWDSLGHMSLISLIEDTFDVEFKPEDITKLTSYKDGKNLLKKYNINVV